MRRIGNSTVICDYYNANPTSVQAAIQTLSAVKAARKFAALGDMLELGPDEIRYHCELSEAILKNQLSGVFLYGPRMKHLFEALKGKIQFIEWDTSHEKLAEKMRTTVTDGDALLIKGSRGMKMETLFECFYGKPSNEGKA